MTYALQVAERDRKIQVQQDVYQTIINDLNSRDDTDSTSFRALWIKRNDALDTLYALNKTI